LTSKHAEKVASKIEQIYANNQPILEELAENGINHVFLSDNGGEFKGEVKMIQRIRISHLSIKLQLNLTAYSPVNFGLQFVPSFQ